MDLNKIKLTLACIIITGFVFTGCTEEEINDPGDKDNQEETNDQEDTPEVTVETMNANIFAKYVLETYYYWNEEISKDLNKLDPQKKQ